MNEGKNLFCKVNTKIFLFGCQNMNYLNTTEGVVNLYEHRHGK